MENPRRPRIGWKDRKASYSTKFKKRKAWNKGMLNSTVKKEENSNKTTATTSTSKLEGQEYSSSNFKGYRLFDLEILMKIVSDVTCCKLCGSDFLLEEKQTVGLGGEYSLTCQGCNFIETFSNCAKIGKRKSSYEVNQRVVLAARLIGNGLSGLKTFCGIMDMPPPVFPTAFTKLQKTVLNAASDEAEDSMKSAVKEEIKLINDLDEQTENEINISENKLVVKGDGTWQKRGFSSLNGAVSIIGSETEKVIDHEVLTSYCKVCSQWQQKNGSPTGEKWKKWFDVHKSFCKKNYFGTSGGMESVGMIKIFHRSEKKYNIQYTEYIGDGDSKTFFNIIKANPHGSEVTIKKLECIGHVGKRFGYHMRKLKSEFKGKKLSDGRGLFGKGRLTNNIVTKIQTYYTGAIRNNPTSLNGMIRDVWAIWYHMSSSDELPQHQFCPMGRNSWCQYQRAEALNQLKDFHHKKPLPGPVMDAIRPLFIKMTSVTLLKRCLGGHTQNSNESFNSILWKLCPKTVFVGIDTLKFGANIATILFNDGMCGILRVLQRLGITPGLNAVAAAKKKDSERLYKSRIEETSDAKKKRAIYKSLRLHLSDKEEEYAAGAY